MPIIVYQITCTLTHHKKGIARTEIITEDPLEAVRDLVMQLAPEELDEAKIARLGAALEHLPIDVPVRWRQVFLDKTELALVVFRRPELTKLEAAEEAELEREQQERFLAGEVA
jgi:hypothetical protein